MTKLETIIAAFTPAQRKQLAAVLAAMQVAPVAAAATAAMQAAPAPAAPKVRAQLASDHPVVRMAVAKLATPRVYPYALPLSEQELEAGVKAKAFASPTLLEVEGAVKVVLTSMGTLYWYDAKGVELANQVLPPKEATALRAQYAHALTLPVWAS